MQKDKLICFRLTPEEKDQIHTMASLQGINPSDIFRNYSLALLAGDAKIYPPRGEQIAYQD